MNRRPVWMLCQLLPLLLLASCAPALTPSPSVVPAATFTPHLTASPSPRPSRTPQPGYTSTPALPPDTPSPTIPSAPAQNVEWVDQLEGGPAVISRPWPHYAGIGAKLVDLSATSEAASLMMPGTINDIYSHYPQVYVAVEEMGIWIVDVSDRTHLQVAASLDRPEHPRSVVVEGYCYSSCTAGSGHVYAYVTSPREGLFILDVTDPQSPILTGVYDQGQPMAIAVEDGYAYVADGQKGLHVLDLAHPGRPQEVSLLETGPALDIVVDGGLAYLAAGPAGLKIVDISNPSAPVAIHFADDTPPDFPQGEAGGVTVDTGPWFNAGPRFAYLAMGEAGVQILDVTNPQATRAAGFYDSESSLTRVNVQGDSLYAAGTKGLLELRFVPSPSLTQLGPFQLNHLVYSHYSSARMPTVQCLSWINLSGDREKWFLDRVVAAYAPLVTPAGDLRAVIKDQYEQVVATADDYLGQYPDGDGAIPVLMMLGNLHSYQIGWHWGRDEKLLGQEYEKAIALLLQRHPERVLSILDDLLDLGLPIEQAESLLLNGNGPEALLFVYGFSPPYGEPKGQAYTLVQQADGVWSFLPLPTRYSADCQYGASISAAADINDDGETEVVVRLDHAYADGAGLAVQVFAWQDGAWRSRMDWDPLARPDSADAFDGGLWLEDQDKNGVQEIVVHYYRGPNNLPAVDIYQWDSTARKYTDTLPIGIQACGYHAFAEAERLRSLGDEEAAQPWYQEAIRQLEVELTDGRSPCREHMNEWSIRALLSAAENPGQWRK